MTSTECFNSIEIYFKIPYTKITEIVDISDHLTISEFIKYVNNEIRQLLRINEKYDIGIVIPHSFINLSIAECFEKSIELFFNGKQGNAQKAHNLISETEYKIFLK